MTDDAMTGDPGSRRYGDPAVGTGVPPEARLLREKELAEGVIVSSVDGIVAVDREGQIIVWNPAMERLTGVTASAGMGRRPAEVTPELAGEDVRDCFRRALGGESIAAERRRDAQGRAFETHYAPLRARGEEIGGAFAVIRDVTAQQRLEEQLSQAQKMEAVGQLAGGIAHDFNNLLTAILGYCELAQLAPRGTDVSADLGEIHAAARRATELTSRLLAFSRKQVLQSRAFDPNREIRELEPMMQRLLGENITMLLRLDPEVGHVLADPSQLQQVLVNLLVNARDAMPHGGRIVVESRDAVLDDEFARSHTGARPGRYVLLAVSDTGTGMDAVVRKRIFEPFFTTKERGKGTGLGLAQVYGVVKQSGGSIWVYSEPGRGTTFKIYLPRVDAAADATEEGSGARAVFRGSETILVAEDEDVVRALLVRLLRARGYEVIEAADGESALAAASRVAGIDLLLTDVVMTDMSGRDLADRLHELRPGLPVLYISGYTDESIAHHGVLAEGVRLLEKPFTADQLAQRVREALEAAQKR
jgi:two-component system, cell cycle sensor histidine kinase and response regulator CckA